MYGTYERATHVLLLDNSLRMHSLEALDLDKVCVRMLFSPLMRRLWTLQEGALPAKNHRLWFQFRDKATNIRNMRLHIRDAYFSSIGRRGLARDMLRQVGSFTSIFAKDPDYRGADLETVVAGLQYRSVSISSDEPLLIGALLDLNLGTILNGPKSRRMN